MTKYAIGFITGIIFAYFFSINFYSENKKTYLRSIDTTVVEVAWTDTLQHIETKYVTVRDTKAVRQTFKLDKKEVKGSLQTVSRARLLEAPTLNITSVPRIESSYIPRHRVSADLLISPNLTALVGSYHYKHYNIHTGYSNHGWFIGAGVSYTF